LVFLATLDPELRKQKLGANIAGAKALATAFAAKAKAAGIGVCGFRPQRRPRIMARSKRFADTAREGGLVF